MTGRAAFHARIECGRKVGAGFLVADRHLLTCAHVVHDAETVTVTFPGRRDLGALAARVVFHGGWQGRTDDPGDLAVLELDHEVAVRPAVFAPPGAERREPAPELIAYGFPGRLTEGVLASYRAVPGPLIADEWVQLEALSAHGQTLVGGFSGAAVTLRDDTVVGMVTSTTSSHVGRMLPVQVLARYWDGLAGLVPPPAPAPDAGRLELLLRRAERLRLDCDPNRLYASCVDAFAPQPEELFTTLRQAARYVRTEVPDIGAEDRFADRLQRALEERLAPIPEQPSGDRPAAAPWAPIVVELAHSGAGPDQVTVEVSAYRGGHRRPVGTRRVPQEAVRAYVQERVDAAFNQLDHGAEALLAFVLPYEWLDKPVAQWECSAHDSTPLGCAHPLVVAERSRHRSSRSRHELGKKWQELDAARSGTRLHRVGCGTPENPRSLRLRLRDEAAALAGFTSVGEHFKAGLNAPVPVLLWPRTGCPGDDHADGSCAGTAFLERLAESVDGVSPAELPRRVLDLREEAYAADDPDGHWAREVQLLWDDPRCFPEPAACLHSPVG